MRESSPRALLLDAMGTLIGLRRPIGRTYAERAAGHGIRLEADAIEAVFPAILRAAPPLAFPGLDEEAALVAAERAWWADRIDETLQAAGGPKAPAALHRDLFEHYAAAEAWRVYPDVPENLKNWKERGLALAVVSNFDQRLHRLLKSLDLSDFLDLVVVSSRAGAAKPSPHPFQQALAGLGLRPDQAWHVGDSPEDAAGARAAGIRCLIVRRP